MPQWVGLYLAASALVGLSVTYYYDDPGNAKLNTILERGLQLGGLTLVRARLATHRAGCVLSGPRFTCDNNGAGAASCFSCVSFVPMRRYRVHCWTQQRCILCSWHP